jgi:hypothetical protein
MTKKFGASATRCLSRVSGQVCFIALGDPGDLLYCLPVASWRLLGHLTGLHLHQTKGTFLMHFMVLWTGLNRESGI